MSEPKKFFSLEEVNSLIPEVELRLRRLAEKKQSYSSRHDDLFMSELLLDAERAGGKADVDISQIEEDIRVFENFILEFEKDLQVIRDLGCILRNIEKGWIDFPGRWEGQKVYFCWRRGESEVRYYRNIQSISADNRVPISG